MFTSFPVLAESQEDLALFRVHVPRPDDMVGPLVTMGAVSGQTAMPHAGEPSYSECPTALQAHVLCQ